MPKKGGKLSESARARISAARSKPQAICTCLQCGNTFTTHQSEVRRGGGKFCNKKCEGVFKRGIPQAKETCIKKSIALKGRIFTPEWKAKISEALTGKPSNRLGKTHSSEARRKMALSHTGKQHTMDTRKIMSETHSGEKNTSWNGGTSFIPYCPKFNEDLKRRVRAFFNNTCIECGNKQTTEKLSVHHVYFNKKTCCDDSPKMFAPLCRSCHGKTNHSRKESMDKYAKIITDKYGGKSYFSKEEYLNFLKIV